ncbi:beta-ketoacyl synthase N-terminal-like domain-containing protein [Actinomadura parmotrematis]|uniref:Beta-ketoacyl synthase-like N-terminal domain-containing protein n=1 Tax=Actinomadura parmotrematis TaxID=2864039 RepID=A0ABS7G3C9_9ACTN|nr:beta-ketoacyl synthase N-terminal-like domain-containing protein [Actinomadura parmotrematis]MBW8487051.1 hypothetical protein [Actinomadura parmotrematis]
MDITAWTALSPYGTGGGPFAEAVRAGRPAAAAADPADVPDTEVCLVPGFDPRAALGRRGTRAMDRVTGLAVAAVGALVADRPAGPGTALVLGTTGGSAQSMTDFTAASLTGERPFDVAPAAVPGAVMNCAAGQCALRHGLTGPNITIAGGRASGLLGLAHARRLLLAGRAAAVLCGAAEEYSPARSWLEHHGRDGAPARLGEGAAVLRLERAGTPGALARVLAVASGVDAALADVARRALDRARVAPAGVWAATPGLEGAGVPARAAARMPDARGLIGDTGAVAAVFQIAAALAALADAAGRVAVVAGADPAGQVSAAVLRMA